MDYLSDSLVESVFDGVMIQEIGLFRVLVGCHFSVLLLPIRRTLFRVLSEIAVSVTSLIAEDSS